MAAAVENTSCTHKLCRHCWARWPIEEFRFLNRANGRLHPECRECRRRNDQAKREERRRWAVQDGMRKIRRAVSVQQLGNLIAGLMNECGGIEELVTRFVALAMDGTARQRFRAARTLLVMACIMDHDRIAEWQAELRAAGVSPMVQLRRLHEQKRLLPALRALVNNGVLGLGSLLDAVDPAPV